MGLKRFGLLYGTSYNGGLAEAYVLLDGANTKAVYVDTKQLADNSSSNWFSYKQMGESAVLYHTTSNSGAYGTYDYYLLDFDNLAAGGHIFDGVDDFEFVGTFNGTIGCTGRKDFYQMARLSGSNRLTAHLMVSVL